VDFILVCNIWNIHRSGAQDNKQSYPGRPIIPPTDFLAGCSCLCYLGMAHPGSCYGFILTSCRDSSFCYINRPICNSCDKCNRPLFSGFHCSRGPYNYWCEHIFNGNRWRIWGLFCLQVPEKLLTFMVLRRNCWICGKYLNLFDNCDAACSFPESG